MQAALAAAALLLVLGGAAYLLLEQQPPPSVAPEAAESSPQLETPAPGAQAAADTQTCEPWVSARPLYIEGGRLYLELSYGACPAALKVVVGDTVVFEGDPRELGEGLTSIPLPFEAQPGTAWTVKIEVGETAHTYVVYATG